MLLFVLFEIFVMLHGVIYLYLYSHVNTRNCTFMCEINYVLLLPNDQGKLMSKGG